MTTSRRTSKTRLQRIDLYSSEIPRGLGFNSTKSYLEELFPSLEIQVLPSVFQKVSKDKLEHVANRLASARVKDPESEEQCFEPMSAEADYEIRTMRGKARVGGVVYDGGKLHELLMSTVFSKQSLDVASVIFTDRLISTYSRDDMRHHLRMVICGFPSIVSNPGIVEAPAKPREFYILKQKMILEGAGDYQMERLKRSFKGQFVDYGDQNQLEAMKGLALQAVMYHLTLDPFCEDRDCRLFNSHWQAELLRSQVASGELCDKHKSLLEDLGRNPVVRW